MKFLLYGILCSLPFPGGARAFEEDIRPFLNTYCLGCHGGEKVKGKVDFSRIQSRADAEARFELWGTVAEMLEGGEMPPEDEKQPTESERKRVLDWYEAFSKSPIEARPGTFRPRRLSGAEYDHTMRSLFGFELEVRIAAAEQTAVEKSLVKKLLPTDPPGASGFVNDTHGAPLSTVLWDQYSFLADFALNELFSKTRRDQLAAILGEELPEGFRNADFTEGQAKRLVQNFVPRAFRRPVSQSRLAEITAAFEGKEGKALVGAVKTELKVVLMSPSFLFRGLLMEREATGQQPVDSFEMAERLSYFLWGDMPDTELGDLAARGKLEDPTVLESQIARMLASPKARSLAESFGVEWLSLEEIKTSVGNDVPLVQAYSTQPVDFLNYLFTEDRPLMELIDSKTEFVNGLTAGYYRPDIKQVKRIAKPKGIERMAEPNQRITLEKTEERGGILTYPGVLAMNRGPILRGTWILRKILGEHLGEPPADVPPIKGSPKGQNLTFRERFEMHRSDPSCARCHEKIDPLGFALQRFDGRGGFKAIKPDPKPHEKIDTTGRLPGGETFKDFAELKQILLTGRRERIVRNMVERTLSYALCRKLVRGDQPTVDAISKKMLESDGTWRDLFVEVANSLPFRETVVVPIEES